MKNRKTITKWMNNFLRIKLKTTEKRQLTSIYLSVHQIKTWIALWSLYRKKITKKRKLTSKIESSNDLIKKTFFGCSPSRIIRKKAVKKKSLMRGIDLPETFVCQGKNFWQRIKSEILYLSIKLRCLINATLMVMCH